MIQKLIRFIFTVLGGLVGYGVFALIRLLIGKFYPDISLKFTDIQGIVLAIILCLIFAFIFFRLTPFVVKQGRKTADGIGADLQKVSGVELAGGIVGLVIGLVIAFLISQIYRAIPNSIIYAIVTIVTYLVLGYLGVVIGTRKGKDLISQLVNRNKGEQAPEQLPTKKVPAGDKKKKKNVLTPKVLDTSVIIDGRIAEIMKTGFLEGPIVIPEFVLDELRHIADSADDLKRARGRRGLDVLKKIQTDYGIEIYNTNSEKTLKDIAEVDVKLLKLAQKMNAKVVTNDFNLNKVAAINGVDVLNINDLANTLKPVVIPGEKMTVTPVKEGKDSNQSIAYLDDGTMIVLEDGKNEIGVETEITVTSVLQTSAGRMIFGRVHV